jgi:phage baseplate assembly protein W
MARISNSLHWQPVLGGPGIVEATADIDQAIRIILKTPKGSDPHRPDFGSNLSLYLDYPIHQAIPHVVRETVEAIRQWEPRCALVKVTPSILESQMTINVRWKLSDGVLRETGVKL